MGLGWVSLSTVAWKMQNVNSKASTIYLQVWRERPGKRMSLSFGAFFLLWNYCSLFILTENIQKQKSKAGLDVFHHSPGALPLSSCRDSQDTLLDWTHLGTPRWTAKRPLLKIDYILMTTVGKYSSPKKHQKAIGLVLTCFDMFWPTIHSQHNFFQSVGTFATEVGSNELPTKFEGTCPERGSWRWGFGMFCHNVYGLGDVTFTCVMWLKSSGVPTWRDVTFAHVMWLNLSVRKMK